jgi:dihydroorotase
VAGLLQQIAGASEVKVEQTTGLPRNTGKITLVRESWTPPDSFAFGEAQLKPLRSGEALPWKLLAA